MLIPLNDIVLIYEKILEELNIDYVSVIIYTAVDIDSLCSIKMLTKLLKSENIHYKIYPVTSYTELEQKIEDSKQYQTVKLFMFINCGGMIDLTQKWFVLNQENAAKVLLFDVNKPFDHHNLESEFVFVIDDKHSGLDNRITTQELNKLEELNQFDLDDFQDDSDEQSEKNNDLSPKRKAKTLLSQKLNKHREILLKKKQEYYGHTFFSLPTSYCLYRLIRELNRANNYSLWYAIVGMTSMYLENNISRQILEQLTSFFRSDMVKFNANNNQKKQKGEIFTKKGYQFPLINHWSLYESMMNSSYLMTKLGLWNDKGVKTLHQILTQIGISLQQSKQQYKYMLKQLKESWQQNIFAVAEKYRLVQITYESFMRQSDSSSGYMASDFFYLITAVLQRPLHKSTLKELSQHRLDCFWSAYSLLDGSQEMIQKALQQFKQISNIMMKQIRDIIERDNIVHFNKGLSFVNIRCDTKEKRLFQHPNMLVRLASILMGIQRQKKNSSAQYHGSKIPYVVSLQDVEKNICLVVGVVPDQKNYMRTKFNTVLHKFNIPAQHDRFLSNVVIIPKENLLEFIKEVAKNE